ncbi:MAG: copper amine oxidase N-terminal domain-containing protein [Oscillospiraceae bacterium]|nr:copper amine oxidase N-terminal domain-containing protein [Oscillospiraceae bacterium]
MKRKAIVALLMAVVMVIGAVGVFALDDAVPGNAVTVTARFSLVAPDDSNAEFAMVSEGGELVIHVTNDTRIYFEDFVPLSDDCDGVTQMVRDVLFGRTLAEVLDGRNLRVTFEQNGQVAPISIVVLFETAVTLPQEVDLENDGYMDFVTLPDYISPEDLERMELNGELVVNNEILEDAALPFLQETENGDVVMVPLRAIAEALGYEVTWNAYLSSVQLGAAIHVWIGDTEAHRGRMAPIELSVAPIIVNDRTFVPMDFFSAVLGQTVYVLEGQVVIETYSDME